MSKHTKEAQTFTELARQHGFSIPNTGDEKADYRRMEHIAATIGKWRRRDGLPDTPCLACGQRKSGCWFSPDGRDQLCVNAPSSIDFGEENDGSDW